ncbi:MAG: hypothetical protein GKR91_05485 [Pseudomonadales bacterium]|nr:hypothetical protein [Pseudomonadales bacterium]
MANEQYFESKESDKLWDSYFAEVDRLTSHIPPEQRKAIRQELESHAYEAFTAQDEIQEPERLRNALEKLGSPELIVPPLISEESSYTVKTPSDPADQLRQVIHGVSFTATNLVRGLVILFLALFAVTFFVIALLKPFTPETVGWFTDETGFYAFGIIDNSLGLTEHLGFFVILIALLVSFVLFKLCWILIRPNSGS